MGMYLLCKAADSATVERLRRDPEAVPAWMEEGTTELDKGWDLVGRLLVDGDPTGIFEFAHPLGPEDTDLGYGPPLVAEGGQLEGLRAAVRKHDADTARAYVTSDGARQEPPYPFFQGIPAEEVDEVVQWAMDLLAAIAEGLAEVPEGGGLVMWMG